MTLQIVQITDTHISNDVPTRLTDLENCIQAINALQTPPDLVIHTGDISHDGIRQEYHNAKLLLDTLNAPYYVMAGNRDNRTILLNEFADDRYHLPKQGWVQYSIEDYPVRLIMVDTLSEQSNKGQLCPERLQHLETMLLADTSKPVALFLHHTPYEAAGIPDPFQYENWKEVETLSALLSQFKNICGMYCGHVHRFIDGEIAGIQASAISCLACDLRKGEMTEEQREMPVFKVLTFPSKNT